MAPSNVRIRLQVVEGPDAGKEFDYEDVASIVLGRAATSEGDLSRPTDPYFSRFHLQLDCYPDGCVVRDLGSRNGVFVNGARVAEAVLRSGDLIRAGRTTMRFEVRAEPKPVAHDTGALFGDGSGASLRDYDVGPLLGSGAFGEVHEARERATGARVALKTLRPTAAADPLVVLQFLREIRVTETLRHPGIVRILAAGREEGRLWYAMQMFDGSTLEETLDARGTLSVPEACEVGVQVLDAVAYAHSHGVVHRDIKPANLILTEKDRRTVKVIDFGLAKVLRDTGGIELTRSGEPKGTPWFMAPEQVLAARRSGPAADQFGLGATLYHALTGAWHFGPDPDAAGVWRAILEGAYVPLRERRPDVPARLAAVIDRCMARTPAGRFPSAREARDALRAARDDGAPTATA